MADPAKLLIEADRLETLVVEAQQYWRPELWLALILIGLGRRFVEYADSQKDRHWRGAA